MFNKINRKFHFHKMKNALNPSKNPINPHSDILTNVQYKLRIKYELLKGLVNWSIYRQVLYAWEREKKEEKNLSRLNKLHDLCKTHTHNL